VGNAQRFPTAATRKPQCSRATFQSSFPSPPKKERRFTFSAAYTSPQKMLIRLGDHDAHALEITRSDHSIEELRREACRCEDSKQAQRLLALQLLSKSNCNARARGGFEGSFARGGRESCRDRNSQREHRTQLTLPLCSFNEPERAMVTRCERRPGVPCADRPKSQDRQSQCP
jgi:hypothetical protein